MKRINIYTILVLLLTACNQSVKNAAMQESFPPIYPDYVGVTIPANIAPMNFDYVGGDYSRIDVRVKGGKSGELHIAGKDVRFPMKDWDKLLTENIGDSLTFVLSVKQQGEWRQYRSFSMYVSKHPIDYGIVYRKIAPGYEVYSKMGIYERDLSTYVERPLIENTLVPGMCVNCHTFNKTDPSHFIYHVRGRKGGTMVQDGRRMNMLNTKTDSTLSSCVYPYWHPQGEYIAYSVNETRQSFHTDRSKRVEVIDLASDLLLYHVEMHEFIQSPLLKSKENYETFPAFSADGKKLYFCLAAVKELPKEYNKIRYNLCSINFDAETGTFGEHIDTLINAEAMEKSISFPRPSYDGKYIMFTLSDYGNFSIWHKEADLWMLNLENNLMYPLTAANSEDTESFHNWSRNSRWFVFSSRRDDGLYTRVYFAMIDDNGQSTKPFMLPQKQPKDYNDYSVYSYNVPDFVSEPVQLDIRRAERRINAKKRIQVTLRE